MTKVTWVYGEMGEILPVVPEVELRLHAIRQSQGDPILELGACGRRARRVLGGPVRPGAVEGRLGSRARSGLSLRLRRRSDADRSEPPRQLSRQKDATSPRVSSEAWGAAGPGRTAPTLRPSLVASRTCDRVLTRPTPRPCRNSERSAKDNLGLHRCAHSTVTDDR